MDNSIEWTIDMEWIRCNLWPISDSKTTFVIVGTAATVPVPLLQSGKLFDFRNGRQVYLVWLISEGILFFLLFIIDTDFQMMQIQMRLLHFPIGGIAFPIGGSNAMVVRQKFHQPMKQDQNPG